MRAHNFTEYQQAVGRWSKPALNLVLRRRAGTDRLDCTRFCPHPAQLMACCLCREMAVTSGPASGVEQSCPRATIHQGYLTTSNEMNLPADYPYKQRKLGFEWSDPSCHQRIDEVLAAIPKVSLEDSMRLQNDVLSIPARRLLASLKPLTSDDAETQAR